MDRSSRLLQDLEVFGGLQSLQRSLSSCRLKCASTVVVSMRISIGVKRVQAQRPRACKKPPALDRDPQRLILGYASPPLIWSHASDSPAALSSELYSGQGHPQQHDTNEHTRPQQHGHIEHASIHLPICIIRHRSHIALAPPALPDVPLPLRQN